MACNVMERSKLSNNGAPDFMVAVKSNVVIKFPSIDMWGLKVIDPTLQNLFTRWR
jgi:hypothetical protein